MAMSNFFCNPCNESLDDEMKLQEHLTTDRHNSMIQASSFNQQQAQQQQGYFASSAKSSVTMNAAGEATQLKRKHQSQQHPYSECQMCSVKCMSATAYQLHINGSKHQKKLKENDYLEKVKAKDPAVFCDTCNLTLHPELMTTHRTGMKHLNAMKAQGDPGAAAIIQEKKSKVAGVKAMQSVKKNGAPSLTQMLPQQEDYQQLLSKVSKEELVKLLGKRFHMECSVCKVEFSTFSQAEHHFNSKAHRTAYLEHQKQQILSKGKKCDMCDVIVSSDDLYQSHIKGYKHTLKANGGQIPREHEYYDKFMKQQEIVQNLKAKKP